MLKKVFMFIGVIAVISVIGSAMGGGEDTAVSTDDTTYADEAVEDLEEVADEESAADEAAEEEPVKKERKAKPEPQYTSGQANAIAKAQDYLGFTSFSKKGLIEQLKFDDFKPKDAVFAVNRIKVNWNNQAVAKAKDYLEFSSFSKPALVDQLEFDGFTPAQANFGANKAY